MKLTPIAVAAALFAAGTPAQAQVIIDMTKITCGEFLNAQPEQQAVVASWMSGYFSASQNIDMLDLRYLDRNLKVVGEYCAAHRNDNLMSVISKKAK